MFTDPELVRVGLSESEAKRVGVEYRVAKMPIAKVLRTRTLSDPRGFMKMLLAAQSDRILGFTALGVEASELLAVVQTAMPGSLTLPPRCATESSRNPTSCRDQHFRRLFESCSLQAAFSACSGWIKSFTSRPTVPLRFCDALH